MTEGSGSGSKPLTKMDTDSDPGGPSTCGSGFGSATLPGRAGLFLVGGSHVPELTGNCFGRDTAGTGLRWYSAGTGPDRAPAGTGLRRYSAGTGLGRQAAGTGLGWGTAGTEFGSAGTGLGWATGTEFSSAGTGLGWDLAGFLWTRFIYKCVPVSKVDHCACGCEMLNYFDKLT